MLNDEWLTPPELLYSLDDFDLDPCSCTEPRPWMTAAAHIARPDDGLAVPWWGRVWLNPPYGGPNIVGPWMRRMVDHGTGMALIFARTETELFHETVWRAATGVRFLKGRLFFCYRDGTQAKSNAGAPSCLVAYGEADAERLANLDIPGHYVSLDHGRKR